MFSPIVIVSSWVSMMMKQACCKDNAVGKRESAERSRGSETNGRECKTDGSR